MSRNFLPAVCLLFFLLVLLTCCVICEPSFAEESDEAGQNPLILFQEGAKFENGDEARTEKGFKLFTSPSFGYFGNMLVVFAQAKENGNGKKCDIVEGYFKVGKDGKLTDKFVGSETLKTKQIVTKNDGTYCKGSPTAIFNNTHIYVFLNSSKEGETKYEFIGNKKDNVEGNDGITWEDLPADLTNQLKGITEQSGDIFPVASGGSGIAINNSLIVPVWYTKNTKEFIPIIINASKTGDQQWSLTLIKSFTEGKYTAVVEWGGKLIVMISCSDGYRKVYESTDIEKTWPEAVGSLSGVWGNSKERNTGEYGSQWGFITADIDIGEQEKKRVILVTQTVEAENNYKLHLWMTDNQRVFDAGEIANEVGQNISSTLLFEKDNLFAAYEKWGTEKSTIYVVYLKEKLGNIKNVLKIWFEQDKQLLQSCFAADGTIKSVGKCSDDNKIPTNGLVGFLSDNDENTTRWKDKYLCVDATVKIDQTTIKKAKNGLQFNGAGATWPVGDQGQNQRYHFANYGFTLVAMVMIDGDTNGGTNGGTNSVLGFNFGEEGKKKTFGLWCTKKDKWEIGEKRDTSKTTEENSDKNKTYQVVLTLNEKTVSVYIDGKNIKGVSQDPFAADKPLNITYFYFGAETSKEDLQPSIESHVTVRNVLLYNWPFTSEKEIKKLLPKKEIVETNVQQTNEPKNTKPQTPKESTTETDSSFQDTSNNESEKEEAVQSLSPPPTTEDGAARVGVVGVLCFMLFGVFTLLGRYVY